MCESSLSAIVFLVWHKKWRCEEVRCRVGFVKAATTSQHPGDEQSAYQIDLVRSRYRCIRFNRTKLQKGGFHLSPEGAFPMVSDCSSRVLQ